MARPNLPPSQAGRFRSDVASAIAKCHQRGMDLELDTGRLILKSDEGTRFYLAADDSGVVYLVNLATGTAQALPAAADDLTALDTRVTAAESDIDALQATDTSLDSRLDALEAVIPTVVARMSAFVSLSAGNNFMTCDIEDLDTGGNFASGIFTAPTTGAYLVTMWCEIAGTSLNASNSMAIVGSVSTGTRIFDLVGTTDQYGEVSKIIYLTAGQTIRPRININGGSSITGYCEFAVRFLP